MIPAAGYSPPGYYCVNLHSRKNIFLAIGVLLWYNSIRCMEAIAGDICGKDDSGWLF